jgi:hypothetical protein
MAQWALLDPDFDKDFKMRGLRNPDNSGGKVF